eukprot:SM000008S22326  [mRNA]  locus=s8:1058662:1062304:- [translate_table: standard]
MAVAGLARPPPVLLLLACLIAAGPAAGLRTLIMPGSTVAVPDQQEANSARPSTTLRLRCRGLYVIQATAFFKQRYFESLTHFREPDGPIFLIVCGEYVCPGIQNDYTVVLAAKYGAALVALEHRYYGESWPFSSLSTENLRYLSSKQAIFDLATFRHFYQARHSCLYMEAAAGSINRRYNRTRYSGDNPWFVIGVSYPGALSAWFRLKFPHLTLGSLASSAVVHAIVNYTAFDMQVANNEDFLYLLADAAALAMQYGHPSVLCGPLVAASRAGFDLMEEFAAYVNSFFYSRFGVDPFTYTREFLSNVTPLPASSGRQWWYQTCTEFGFFQTAPEEEPLRSASINFTYHANMCDELFEKKLLPDAKATNTYYGGRKIAGSHIIFTNGSQDPWRHASKQNSSISDHAHCCNVYFRFAFLCQNLLLSSLVAIVDMALTFEDVLKARIKPLEMPPYVRDQMQSTEHAR